MSRVERSSGRRRPYRLVRRAERQDETRRRITDAAVELHTSIGPALTTVSAIARRAGVERLTVYRHFPDLKALFAACSSRFSEQHPPPDLRGAMLAAEPLDRVEHALGALYSYYRETQTMLRALVRDAEVVRAHYVDPQVEELAQLAYSLAAGFPDGSDQPMLTAAVGHALEFTTWSSLTGTGALSDDEAAVLMTTLVGTVASGASKRRPRQRAGHASPLS
jgi:AcrR family transcriptional regulator